MTELARAATLGNSPWVPATSYTFVLEYSPTLLRGWVDGALEIELTGSFPSGGFALYNFSQAGLVFGPITFEFLNEAPSIDGAAADVTVDEGTTATNTGSFVDSDGDPLTLSCGCGCDGFTDNGDGTWSWASPEPNVP